MLYLSHPGFFGEVFRGIWNGTEVAIKVFLEQDLTAENMEDFCNEISILRYVVVDMLIVEKIRLYITDLHACSSCVGCACFIPAAFDILMVLSLTCYSSNYAFLSFVCLCLLHMLVNVLFLAYKHNNLWCD